MPDEFPTLEAVAAVGVLALLLRTLLVTSEMGRVRKFASELVRALVTGPSSAALALCNEPEAPAFARSVRELLTVVGDATDPRDAGFDLERERTEHEQDLARRSESGRARDLIVLAVLLGAMAFAFLSNLHVSRWFHLLAVLACLLLVVGFALRSRLSRMEHDELERITLALGRLLQAPNTPRARPSLHSIDGGCRACGESLFLLAHGAALGPALPALSIHELRICKNCGLVSGQAEDAAVVAQAALEELSVPLQPDDESSSDDTEHDG